MAWVELRCKLRAENRSPVLVNLDKYISIYIDPDSGLNIWGVRYDGIRADLTGAFDSQEECTECLDKIKRVLLHGQIDQDWDDDGLQGTGLEWLRRTDPNYPDIKDEEFEEVF